MCFVCLCPSSSSSVALQSSQVPLHASAAGAVVRTTAGEAAEPRQTQVRTAAVVGAVVIGWQETEGGTVSNKTLINHQTPFTKQAILGVVERGDCKNRKVNMLPGETEKRFEWKFNEQLVIITQSPAGGPGTAVQLRAASQMWVSVSTAGSPEVAAPHSSHAYIRPHATRVESITAVSEYVAVKLLWVQFSVNTHLNQPDVHVHNAAIIWIMTEDIKEQFCSFTVKQSCSVLLNNWSSWDLI